MAPGFVGMAPFKGGKALRLALKDGQRSLVREPHLGDSRHGHKTGGEKEGVTSGFPVPHLMIRRKP